LQPVKRYFYGSANKNWYNYQAVNVVTVTTTQETTDKNCLSRGCEPEVEIKNCSGLGEK